MLRSSIVRMALLSLLTIKSISLSPNRLPSASLRRSCTPTLFLMPGALVACLYWGMWRYFILCRSLQQVYRLYRYRSSYTMYTAQRKGISLVSDILTVLCRIALSSRLTADLLCPYELSNCFMGLFSLFSR